MKSKGSGLEGVKGNSAAKKGVASENDGPVLGCNGRHPPLPPHTYPFSWPPPQKRQWAPQKKSMCNAAYHQDSAPGPTPMCLLASKVHRDGLTLGCPNCSDGVLKAAQE